MRLGLRVVGRVLLGSVAAARLVDPKALFLRGIRAAGGVVLLGGVREACGNLCAVVDLEEELFGGRAFVLGCCAVFPFVGLESKVDPVFAGAVG